MAWLLDTHALIWLTDDPGQLGDAARTCIDEAPDDVLVSVATIWEIAIKRALGKLTAPHNLEAVIASAGFVQLPTTLSHALGIETLPEHHRDPFDR